MYLWILAAVAAYFIKGLCGFANTLVFTSILSFGVPNANISPIDLLLGYPTNLILTWKNRRSLAPKVYLPLAALVLAGSIPGAFLLKHVDARAVKVLFGVVVAALGAEMFSREYSKKRLRSSKIVLAIIGVTAGVLCGLFGVGALLAAYVSRVTEDGGSFEANISAETILAAGVPELQSLGMTFRKAEYITDFAEKVHTGAFDLDAVAHMRDADAIRALSSLKGIGVWTAEMILLFCLQRPDIFSYDDLAIQRGLRMVYHHRAIDRRLFEKYRRRYSPYGSVASLYLWAVSGGAIPELKDYKPKNKREAH